MQSFLKFKKHFVSPLVLILLLESSCAHVARLKLPPPPAPRPQSLVDYYRYVPLKTKPLVYILKMHRHYTEKKVIFRQVEDTSGHHAPLVLEYFEPTAQGAHPLILITPVLGRNYGIERSFATYFANHGFA